MSFSRQHWSTDVLPWTSQYSWHREWSKLTIRHLVMDECLPNYSIRAFIHSQPVLAISCRNLEWCLRPVVFEVFLWTTQERVVVFFSLLNLNYFSPCHGLVTFVPYPFELLFKLFGIVLLICCPPWNPSMPKSGPVHLFPCTFLGSHLPAFPAASWSAAHLDVINLQCLVAEEDLVDGGFLGSGLPPRFPWWMLRWSIFASNLGSSAESTPAPDATSVGHRTLPLEAYSWVQDLLGP